jgi:hypothetical protein
MYLVSTFHMNPNSQHATRYTNERGVLKLSGDWNLSMVSSFVVQTHSNLFDQEGGYHKRFMFLPQPKESLIMPIVNVNRHHLRINQGENGRLELDQSMMIYHPPKLDTKKYGNTVSVF